MMHFDMLKHNPILRCRLCMLSWDKSLTEISDRNHTVEKEFIS